MVCRKEISFFESHYIMRKNRKKEEKIRWVIHNLTAVSKIEAQNSRLHKQTRKVPLFTLRSRYPEEFKAVCE